MADALLRCILKLHLLLTQEIKSCAQFHAPAALLPGVESGWNEEPLWALQAQREKTVTLQRFDTQSSGQ